MPPNWERFNLWGICHQLPIGRNYIAKKQDLSISFVIFGAKLPGHFPNKKSFYSLKTILSFDFSVVY
jgi:hypothetical protein